MSAGPRITLLAGGVGGAKMAEGLAASRYGRALTVIGNIGDDHEFHGLHVSPDIDTMIYSLAGLVDRDQGWGLAGETYRTLDRLALLGAETWMKLGDLDFATHIRRSKLLRAGHRLTEIVAILARHCGVETPIRLPTDDPVRTKLKTEIGWLDFQEYFVRERCRPTVYDIAFAGAENAVPTPEALSAIADADLILVAPSNPLVSIGPMLAVPSFEDALRASSAVKLAISPLIGGRTVKGPADRMLEAQGYRPDPIGLADFYGDLVDGFVIDRVDGGLAGTLRDKGFDIIEDDILMRDADDKRRLAESTVAHALTPGHASCR
ncbi:2-phospho-L-lactate transferase [Salinisphaera sp.]|uniref:2-phospho-L-lactate transferase n=1 Tax=Salinisphaera sp. TaxID=1914330 RepID=UPI002D77F01C|nr:2-phospho-L-lactate transferase [Salinisphaera sp.]HET7314997.1 2-phospho-L-lactate transferase [Salinisphaera sp.]